MASANTAAAPVQHFYSQTSKAIVIRLYRNGDKHHTGEELTLNPKLIKTLDQVYDKATEKVKLVTGAVRKIYKTDLKTQIKKIEEFENEGQYLCCSGEKPAEVAKLPAPFQ